MEQFVLSLGFGNNVVAEKIVAVLSPKSSPMKRIKDEARDQKRLIDVTHGRKTRAIVITESNHIILSSIQAEKIAQRFESLMQQGKK